MSNSKERKDNTILGSKLVIYESALNLIGSKLVLLKSSFDMLPYSASKTEHCRLGDIKEILSRIKTDESIKGKLRKNKKALNYENAKDIVKDIVGYRLICMYEKDIFTLVELIRNMGLNVIREKDYITHPKESGYRSYHMNLEVPIYLPDDTIENVLVEIQIRTDFMDLWASREHEMKYKSQLSKEELATISQALIDLSGAIHLSQEAMEHARIQQLCLIEGKKSEDGEVLTLKQQHKH